MSVEGEGVMSQRVYEPTHGGISPPPLSYKCALLPPDICRVSVLEKVSQAMSS